MADSFLRDMITFSDEMIQEDTRRTVQEIEQITTELGKLMLADCEKIRPEEETTIDEEAQVWVINQIGVAIHQIELQMPERLAKDKVEDLIQEMTDWATHIYIKHREELHIKPDKDKGFITGLVRLLLELTAMTYQLHNERVS